MMVNNLQRAYKTSAKECADFNVHKMFKDAIQIAAEMKKRRLSRGSPRSHWANEYTAWVDATKSFMAKKINACILLTVKVSMNLL